MLVILLLVATGISAMGVMLMFIETCERLRRAPSEPQDPGAGVPDPHRLVLVADGLGQHVPKGDVYSSMAFSLGLELLNRRYRRRSRRA